MSETKPKPTYAEQCIARAACAPLRSDDHKHNVDALREYCEIELCEVYGTMVPELARRLARAIRHIELLGSYLGRQNSASFRKESLVCREIINELEAPLGDE